MRSGRGARLRPGLQPPQLRVELVEAAPWFTSGAWVGPSLQAGRGAAITVGLGVRTYSDRTGPESQARHKGRDNGVQLPLSLALEIHFSQAWTGFLRVEGNPLSADRKLLADHPTDTHVYGSLGAAVAF